MAEKIFTVDKFLGLNESVDGTTELKMGEASKIENFYITDDYNLKNRPGIRKYKPTEEVDEIQLSDSLFIWSGYLCGKAYLLWAKQNDTTYDLYSFCKEKGVVESFSLGGNLPVCVFQNAADVHLLLYYEAKDLIQAPRLYEDPNNADRLTWERDNTEAYDLAHGPYIPLAITGCDPAGGGTALEPLNILTNKFRVSYTTAASANDRTYVLPAIVNGVVSMHIGGLEIPASTCGTFDGSDTAKKTFTITAETGVQPGVEMVLVCTTDDADLAAAKAKFLKMPHSEPFNGATDSRVFFYGDGSNVCYYSGIPAFGFERGYGDSYFGTPALGGYPEPVLRDGTHQIPALYVPAGNELAVDFSDSPITSMVRHYSRLLVFKPDGVDAITYEPMTLADGSVIAGFYLHPVHRKFGNDAPGQVKLINNSPRSFSKGSIYEWRVSSSYRDERYAKLISERVAKTIAAADPAKLVAFDDEVSKTYYVFLNDDAGTVLVNRYDLGVWSLYRSILTMGVSQCLLFDGKMVFLRDGIAYCFDEAATFDAPLEDGGDHTPIRCLWESGYMAFGADYRRKYSSNLWVSMLPEANSKLEITVQTDRRDEYLEKVTGLPLMDFSCLDFSNFSFLRRLAPQIKRIKIKVKKFVYYKLIFRVTQPGARATVLGYDQQVRYSSNVK